MSNGICISWEKLNSSVEQLKQKIDAIDHVYKEMNDIYKEIDGTTDTWVGDNQKKFYQSYLNIAEGFPSNIEKFKEYYTFLGNVRDSYRESDSTSIASAENNKSDLMV